MTNRKMTHWQDKGTCPQALPVIPGGASPRPSLWHAHPRRWAGRMMIIFFGSSSKPERPKAVIIMVASEAVPPGPTCEGTNPEKPKAPSAPSGKPGAATRPGLQAKANPQPHTPLGSPLLFLLSPSRVFVLPTSFFQFLVVTEFRCFRALPRWCQHQILTTAQNAALVVTQTHISQALPRWC